MNNKFMKTNRWQNNLATLVVAGLVVSAGTALAQYSQPPAPAGYSATPPTLSNGVPQILQLVHGKISDDTIIAYINNSRINYALDANQIIYLRQQGVSDLVITSTPFRQ